MNIIMIMSGGVGSRFGSAIPKQYNLLSGVPVIDYVIDACHASKKADKIVVVMDNQWINYSEKLKTSGFDIAPNGDTRLKSMYSGLKLIKEKYPCEKLVVVDAVRPFIYPELLDEYFDRLDASDAVITSEKITGGFTDISSNCLNRDDYIITQSPEAFRFELLWNNFDVEFPYQETACMLPKECKRDYYYGFKNNLKLTYDYELGYAEFILKNYGRISNKDNIAFFDKEILITEGIKACLLANYEEQTLQWIDEVYAAIPRLVSKWQLTFFIPNQVSRFGLVLLAKSLNYGEVIVKFIPSFIDRFDRELEAMKYLSPDFMCPLLDYDASSRAMLIGKIVPANYASFENNLRLTDFFKKVIGSAVKYDEGMAVHSIPRYYDELCSKLAHMEIVPYCKDEVRTYLEKAIKMYDDFFADAEDFIIHGDLHELNVLDDGERFWGIDPIGFIGPIEFELVRFIRNDVRNHQSFGLYERFEMLVANFSRFVDSERLVRAYIVDMGFCLYNSTYENETPEETLLDIKLIENAEKWLEKHLKQ